MKKKAVAYVRVSTESDAQLHSFEFQSDYWRNTIAQMPGYQLVALYADKGISGKQTNNRHQFLAMIAAAERGEFDTIFVKSVSRFARCAEDTMAIVKRLREKSVNIIFEDENIDTANAASELYLTIAAAIAEDANRTNADNMRWSTRKKFAEGKVTIGHGMFGYRVKDGNITIEESEAAVVRLIFQRYLDGVGKQGIANELSEQGYISYTGNTAWSAQTLNNMLQNERYIGCALLQKTITVEGKSIKNDGLVTQYFVEDSHPAIIDKATFERVQKEMKTRRDGRTYSFLEDDEYAFRSKLICGHCGKGYIHKINNAGTPYAKPMWACHTYLKRGKNYCKGRTIFNYIIEDIFTAAYNEFVERKKEFMQETDLIADKTKALEDERKLSALLVRKLISREEYKKGHAEILERIAHLDAEIKRQSLADVVGRDALPIVRFEASKVRQYLTRAVIQDGTITFEFANGFVITKQYSNGTGGNKKGWKARRNS